jgi:hypothetical protein
MNLGKEQIEQAFSLLAERLELMAVQRIGIVVCGGSALIASSLVSRQTTKDVDVVAMADESGHLTSPDPLPPQLLLAVEQVGRDLDLPSNWLNNGPSRHPGGLFQCGLPDGFETRLVRRDFSPSLTVFFVGRLDQICFKVFAAVDQGPGRHVSDLRDLNPTADEIAIAARWAVTHDPSEGFCQVLVSMLRTLGYEHVASKL